MKTRTRNVLMVLLFTVIMTMLALLIVVLPKGATSASAATNSSAVCTTKGKIESTSGNILRDAPTDNYTVTMQSLRASGTDTIENNAIIDWTYVIFKVNVISVGQHRSYSLVKDGVTIAGGDLSGRESLTLYSGDLSDGNYVLTYVCNYSQGSSTYPGARYVFRFSVDISAPTYELKADGRNIANGGNTSKNITYFASDSHFQRLYYKSPTASSYSSTTSTSYSVEAKSSNSGWWYFYATDSIGNKSETVSIYLDCLPPTMSCANGMSFGTTVGSSIKVTTTDIEGSAKLYVKFESEEWFSTGSSYTIPDTERNGRYYFYAEDGNGNRSETSWIILSTEEPSGSLIKSESDNSRSFVWNNEYWSATLDGSNYVEGRTISNEGQHEIILSNNANKTKNYNFKIEHYYKMVSQTAATCIENGIAVYECSQCGNSYEETQYSGGHSFNIVSTPASCTENEHIVYSCSKCGERYETEGNYPTGHSYVITIIKEPTCTEEGIRINTCEKCGDSYETVIEAKGHNYGIAEMQTSNGNTTRIYTCLMCGHSYNQELGNQYEEVSNYVEYLFKQYSPYMWWVFLASVGIWSIVMGVMFAIAQKNEEKEKSKKMIVNYVIGLVVIAVIVVACPFLIRGIAAVVT